MPKGRAGNRLAPSNHVVCWREPLCVDRDRSLSRNDADDATSATGAEEHGPRLEREQGVVGAAAHVHAGVEVRAPLANDDLAGVDELAAETLDAEALTLGVAPVPGGTGALLVCHLLPCLLSRAGVSPTSAAAV